MLDVGARGKIIRSHYTWPNVNIATVQSGGFDLQRQDEHGLSLFHRALLCHPASSAPLEHANESDQWAAARVLAAAILQDSNDTAIWRTVTPDGELPLHIMMSHWEEPRFQSYFLSHMTGWTQPDILAMQDGDGMTAYENGLHAVISRMDSLASEIDRWHLASACVVLLQLLDQAQEWSYAQDKATGLTALHCLARLLGYAQAYDEAKKFVSEGTFIALVEVQDIHTKKATDFTEAMQIGPLQEPKVDNKKAYPSETKEEQAQRHKLDKLLQRAYQADAEERKILAEGKAQVERQHIDQLSAVLDELATAPSPEYSQPAPPDVVKASLTLQASGLAAVLPAQVAATPPPSIATPRAFTSPTSPSPHRPNTMGFALMLEDNVPSCLPVAMPVGDTVLPIKGPRLWPYGLLLAESVFLSVFAWVAVFVWGATLPMAATWACFGVGCAFAVVALGAGLQLLRSNWSQAQPRLPDSLPQHQVKADGLELIATPVWKGDEMECAKAFASDAVPAGNKTPTGA